MVGDSTGKLTHSLVGFEVFEARIAGFVGTFRINCLVLEDSLQMVCGALIVCCLSSAVLCLQLILIAITTDV